MWFTNCAVKFRGTFSNPSEKITCRSQSLVLLHINRFVRNIAWFYTIRYTLHIFLDSLTSERVSTSKSIEIINCMSIFQLNLEHKVKHKFFILYQTLFYFLIYNKQKNTRGVSPSRNIYRINILYNNKEIIRWLFSLIV